MNVEKEAASRGVQTERCWAIRPDQIKTTGEEDQHGPDPDRLRGETQRLRVRGTVAHSIPQNHWLFGPRFVTIHPHRRFLVHRRGSPGSHLHRGE